MRPLGATAGALVSRLLPRGFVPPPTPDRHAEQREAELAVSDAPEAATYREFLRENGITLARFPSRGQYERAALDALEGRVDSLRREIAKREEMVLKTGSGGPFSAALHRQRQALEAVELACIKLHGRVFAPVTWDESDQAQARCRYCRSPLADRHEAFATGSMCQRCIAEYEERRANPNDDEGGIF